MGKGKKIARGTESRQLNIHLEHPLEGDISEMTMSLSLLRPYSIHCAFQGAALEAALICKGVRTVIMGEVAKDCPQISSGSGRYHPQSEDFGSRLSRNKVASEPKY